ncbi:hypothetical protein OC835_005864 [Tilletia horrida]|nr:hypothetical protein OC835_005864 [Tilletia horrida]KAK0567147.1 hypothetical protein OC844_000392 [Tilletia horrida]
MSTSAPGFMLPGIPSTLLAHLPSVCDIQRNAGNFNEHLAQLRAWARLATDTSARDQQMVKQLHGHVVADLHHLQAQVLDELSVTRAKVVQEVHAVQTKVQEELDAAQRRLQQRLAGGMQIMEQQLSDWDDQSHKVFEHLLRGIQESVTKLESGARMGEEDKIRLSSQLALFASWASAW